MFVDVVPNRKSPPTILIRQSCREGGKVKKRTLANTAKLPPEIIEKIRAVLSGAVLAVLRADGNYEQARKAFIARQPMGRIGTPEEVAALTVYLASDESNCITGIEYVIRVFFV